MLSQTDRVDALFPLDVSAEQQAHHHADSERRNCVYGRLLEAADLRHGCEHQQARTPQLDDTTQGYCELGWLAPTFLENGPVGLKLLQNHFQPSALGLQRGGIRQQVLLLRVCDQLRRLGALNWQAVLGTCSVSIVLREWSSVESSLPVNAGGTCYAVVVLVSLLLHSGGVL